MNEDQRNEIRDTGELDLGGIHVMTVIGEIEGHQLSAPRTPRQPNMSI